MLDALLTFLAVYVTVALLLANVVLFLDVRTNRFPVTVIYSMAATWPVGVLCALIDGALWLRSKLF